MKEVKVSWLVFSGFIGILLGTIFANCMERLAPNSLAVFALDQYSISEWIFRERKSLSIYLFQQRGFQFIGMLVLGFFCNSVILLFLFTFFGGLVWGLMLSVETMRLGIQGLFLAVSCFFPQGICYILAVWLFLFAKEQVRQRETRTIGILSRCILLPLAVTVAGILMEIWISPGFIQWMMK
ncbi:MAG: hypothetical protein NC089_01035 [Bacteroides sp.]|nr:hypothetical protein [Bacteroides sp.]MCM1549797.1 hypothetical protein [Clostridium sp.]